MGLLDSIKGIFGGKPKDNVAMGSPTPPTVPPATDVPPSEPAPSEPAPPVEPSEPPMEGGDVRAPVSPAPEAPTPETPTGDGSDADTTSGTV